jgi:hypothetical protein
MPAIDLIAIGPGTKLREGRYELVRLLGSGGMATVWEAQDTRLGRPVAVKVLSDALAHDEEYLARFRREARLAAGLSHPGLVNVFDFEAGSERPYLVMEHVDGGTLAERLREDDGLDGGPPGREPLDSDLLGSELLKALAYIHRAGIVHRDVKPANVLLRSDGCPCLTDFGVATPQDATRITQTGQIPGTKDYMAPELLEGEPASELSDLYACGIVLRETAGRLGGSARLIALADELAEPEPAGRPPSAEAALERLERPALEPVGAATELWSSAEREPVSGGEGDEGSELAADTGRSSPFPPPVWSTPRPSPRQGVWALAAAAAAAVVALIAFSGGGEESAPPAQGSAAAGAGQGAEPSSEKRDRAAKAPTASGDDPALGASLNDRGYDLVNSGDPEAAVPVLERSVEAFPRGTDDINYAYALYNLGHALRVAGKPERAIPVLEERLRFPDQADVVERELELARADARG